MHDQIAVTAKEFLDAFFILSENNERVWLEIIKSNPYSVTPSIMNRLKTGDLKRTSVPDVTCIAFALELYLKSLSTKHLGQAPAIHKLAALFAGLPSNVQDSVIARAEVHIGAQMGSTKFLDRLDKISNAFVDWRYIYETGRAEFLPDFAVALALAVRDEVAA